MERLNNIMRTAQRSYMPAPQHASQQPPMQGQRSPAPMRPLPTEQPNTRTQNRNHNSGYSYTRTRSLPRLPEIPESQWGTTTLPRSPLSRVNYGGQRAAQAAHYIEQTPQVDYYKERSTMIPADVQEDGDDDDTPSIRTGDWESELSSTSVSHYAEMDDYAALMPRSNPATRPPATEINAAAQRLAYVHYRDDAPITREPYRATPDQRRSVAPHDVHEAREVYRERSDNRRAGDVREAHLPIPAPSAQFAPQGIRSKQRNTQPLKPQQVGRVANEMRGARLQPPTLPHTPREMNADYTITVNSAPPPKPTVCPICRGAGYLRNNVAFGHPQFGKPVACQCKEQERKRKRREQLQELSNLGAFAGKRFESFNSRQPGLQEAFKVSSTFAKNPDGWLLFVGTNGCGKTHLAAAIANSCLEDGAVVLFATVPDLLDHLRAAFKPASDEVYDQLFARMREAEVLVLDDLGTQQSSPWANEKLFQLLNYRYNSGFPTVITANPKGLQATDERIRSRLSDTSLVITLNLDHARDYRPNNPRRG